MKESDLLETAFAALARALNQGSAPVRVFFRDDDGGWSNERLQSLCGCFEQTGVPVDLALIPSAMDTTSVALVSSMLARHSMPIHIHQHGYAHINHQSQGRACEFGSDRSQAQQQDDILQGWNLLGQYFAERVEPIFTPPWNRCTNDTVLALKSTGFKCLSRIGGSEVLVDQVAELPVTIDWLKKKKGVRLNSVQIIENVMRAIDAADENNNGVIGIMLHHEHMDVLNREMLLKLISVLKKSPRISFHSMLEIITAGNNKEPMQ